MNYRNPLAAKFTKDGPKTAQKQGRCAQTGVSLPFSGNSEVLIQVLFLKIELETAN